MKKIYVVGLENNVIKDYSAALLRKDHIIEPYNGFTNFIKFGGNKYQNLSYILDSEDQFDEQYIVLLWNEVKYLFINDIHGRLLQYFYEIIGEPEHNSKTKIFIANIFDVKARELADILHREFVDPSVSYNIQGNISFPNKIVCFQLVK